MSMFKKAFRRILAIIIIVAFIAGFREAIVSDKNVGRAFGAMMGVLPFAKVFTDMICKVLGFYNDIPIVSASSVLEDAVKLAVSAGISGPITAGLTRLFLPLPEVRNQILLGDRKTWEYQEEYMNSAGYKIKAMLITIISAPIVAVISGWLLQFAFEKLQEALQGGALLAIEVVILLAASLLSVIFLTFKFTFFTAILYRLVVTILLGSLKVCGVNACCLGVYIFLIKGLPFQMGGTVLAYVIWLILMEAAIKGMTQVIVS